jgi:predicted transcriptional regulator
MTAQDPKKGVVARVRENLFRASRKAPVRTTKQTAHVLERKFGGNRQAMAAAYGVTPTAVGRWLKGTRHPQGAHAEQLRQEAVEVQTTERGRERRARQIERNEVGSNAEVGRTTTFAIRGSDAVRSTYVPLHLSAEELAALTRAESDAEAEQIIGEAIARYFNSGPYAGFRWDDFDWPIEEFKLT